VLMEFDKDKSYINLKHRNFNKILTLEYLKNA